MKWFYTRVTHSDYGFGDCLPLCFRPRYSNCDHAGIGKGAEHGILIKDAQSLELAKK